MLKDSHRRYELVNGLPLTCMATHYETGLGPKKMSDTIATELLPSFPKTAETLQYYRQLWTHCQILGYS